MARTIFRTGNSTVVSLPPEVLEMLDLHPGDEVNVVVDPERRRIVVTPTKSPAASLPQAADVHVGEKLGELIERYAPALERLTRIEEREREEVREPVDIDGSRRKHALHRARALRERFAAEHGVLEINLVRAARSDRRAQSAPGLDLDQEDDDRGSGH